MKPTDFERFEALTFDCYGTLIDWEAGILDAAARLLAGALRRPDEDVLSSFGRLEAEAEVGAYRSYREILTEVACGLVRESGLDDDAADAAHFAASVADWPAFPDSAEALRLLATRYRLAVVSNVDDDLFEGSARRLGVTFDEVVTARQVRSYKPARAHFDEVMRRLDLPRERILHVAQSLYHDIAPARALGFTCVWVNRRVGRSGSGATKVAVANPDLEVPDLRSLVQSMGLGQA